MTQQPDNREPSNPVAKWLRREMDVIETARRHGCLASISEGKVELAFRWAAEEIERLSGAHDETLQKRCVHGVPDNEVCGYCCGYAETPR